MNCCANIDNMEINLKNEIENNIEEIVTNLDLLLEGVTPPKKSHYLDLGLIILESNTSDFIYSNTNLDYLEKIHELKQYFYSIGMDNQTILSLISNFRNKKR